MASQAATAHQALVLGQAGEDPREEVHGEQRADLVAGGLGDAEVAPAIGIVVEQPLELPAQLVELVAREEIGLEPRHYDVITRREGYRYLYPHDVRGKKIRKHGNHGQEQTYFLCHLHPDAPAVNVNQRPREFRAYRWIPPEEFDLDWLPHFKRDVYREVMRDFFGIER